MADLFAKNARLEQPLLTDIDLTEAEQNKIQTQIFANIARLPPFAVASFWSAFIAHHLGTLVSTLRNLSPSTQPKALATLIQILSILPDPKEEPYFRKFLSQPSQCEGLPNLVAAAFVRGVEWKRPSGPGKICTLIINLLFWCDTSLGDDGKAAVDADVRSALSTKIGSLMSSPRFREIEGSQRTEIERLHGSLNAIEQMPGNTFLTSTRQYLEDQLDACANPSCAQIGELRCSSCKSVRYCGKKCQSWHWENGHRLHCFQPAY